MNFTHIKSNVFNKLRRSPETSSQTPIFEEIGTPTSSSIGSTTHTVATAAMAAAIAKSALEIPGPVKAVAAMSFKSGAAGAVVDAFIGGFHTLEPVSKGEMSMKEATIHVASEGVCGFLTASAGTAGTISAYMITGSLGPIVLASGMASSMITRWGYRQIVGETLPSSDNKPTSDDTDTFENIGPKE